MWKEAHVLQGAAAPAAGWGSRAAGPGLAAMGGASRGCHASLCLLFPLANAAQQRNASVRVGMRGASGDETLGHFRATPLKVCDT